MEPWGYYRVCKGLLPVPESEECSEHPPPPNLSWRDILILFFHIHVGPPRSVFLSGFLTKTFYAIVVSHGRSCC
jgi:hypothetical protein